MLELIWIVYDKNKDQTISQDEAKAFIEGYLGEFSPTEAQFRAKYNEIDIDGDGLISKYEMRMFIESTCRRVD